MSKSFTKFLNNAVQTNIYDFFQQFSENNDQVEYEQLINAWQSFEVSEKSQKSTKPKEKKERKPIDESSQCIGQTKANERCKGKKIKGTDLCSVHTRSSNMTLVLHDIPEESESELEPESGPSKIAKKPVPSKITKKPEPSKSTVPNKEEPELESEPEPELEPERAPLKKPSRKTLVDLI